jgi:hypothetical protein
MSKTAFNIWFVTTQGAQPHAGCTQAQVMAKVLRGEIKESELHERQRYDDRLKIAGEAWEAAFIIFGGD